MKINNWYRGEAMSRLLPVPTFRNPSVPESVAQTGSRVLNTCDIRERVQGGSVSAAGSSIALRHDSVRTITAINVSMQVTGKPSGLVQRNGMGAPRGIPPRGRPKWA